MNYCGIDLADKTSAVCVIDEAERVVRRVVVETSEEGLRQAVAGLGEVKVLVEACPLAEWAAQALEAAGCEVEIIDARAAKHLVSSKKKTDARDAFTLARLARTGWYTRVHRKSASARCARSRLQGRMALMRSKKALGSAIRGLLKAHGIKLGAVSEGEFGARVRAVVKERVPDLEETFEQLLTSWEQACRGAAHLEKAMAKISQADESCRLLKTMPGVGPLVSTAFVATLDDPERFSRAEQVPDYLGLTPRVYQSGRVEYRGRITKEGDGLLRWLLVEAAHVLLTRGQDCALKRWGLALEQRKGGGKARVAVARKMAMILWRMWKRAEPFRPWPQAEATRTAA